MVLSRNVMSVITPIITSIIAPVIKFIIASIPTLMRTTVQNNTSKKDFILKIK